MSSSGRVFSQVIDMMYGLIELWSVIIDVSQINLYKISNNNQMDGVIVQPMNARILHAGNNSIYYVGRSNELLIDCDWLGKFKLYLWRNISPT